MNTDTKFLNKSIANPIRYYIKRIMYHDLAGMQG